MLVRFSPRPDAPMRPGLLLGDRVHDLSPRHPTLRSFLEAHPRGWREADIDLAGLESHARASVRLGPPIDDGALVYAVGANYRQHAEEAGLSVPAQPVVFMKPCTAMVGPGEPIRLSPLSSQLDYEGELAVVIGRPATRVTAGEAMAHVAGFTIVNDVTARDLQWVELGKNRIVDWFSSKALDGSSPIGPGIASVSGIDDPHRLRLRTTLNGQTMQDADTSLMVYGIGALIAFASARATLRTGDVLATGTPFGVGGFREIFLKQGDVVRIEIEGIGVLENTVAA